MNVEQQIAATLARMESKLDAMALILANRKKEAQHGR
jgi:hypothetical protein